MGWQWLKERLVHPLTLGLDIDAPETILLRRRIIKGKKFLWLIYRECYRAIVAALPPDPGPLLIAPKTLLGKARDRPDLVRHTRATSV